MTKIVTRIPRTKYGFVEIQQECTTADEERIILENAFVKIDEYAKADSENNSMEVIVENQRCPACGDLVLEKIDVSQRTNKPYHRLRCKRNNIFVPKEVMQELISGNKTEVTLSDGSSTRIEIADLKTIDGKTYAIGKSIVDNKEDVFCSYIAFISVRAIKK